MSVRKIRNKWWVDFRFGEERHRRKSPDNTRSGAMTYEATLRAKLGRGESLNEQPAEPVVEVTFAEFAKEWFDTYAVANTKPATQRAIASYLRLHLLPLLGDKHLRAISTPVIEQYKSEKLRAGLGPKTINEHLGLIAQLLRAAGEWGRAVLSPMRIRRLKARMPTAETLTRLEVAALLSVDTTSLWHGMALVAVRTGLRLGELLALEWRDVDLERGVLRVERNLVRGVIGTPKNGRSRHVVLPDDARAYLVEHRKASGRVFARQDGEFCYGSVGWGLERLCRRAGVRHIGWHALRHTYATDLVERGAPLRAVQALLGHASITMTERYAHARPDMLRDAVALLNLHAPGQPVGNAPTFPEPAVATSSLILC